MERFVDSNNFQQIFTCPALMISTNPPKKPLQHATRNAQHATRTRNTQQRTQQSHATNARNKRTQQLKDFLALIWRQ